MSPVVVTKDRGTAQGIEAVIRSSPLDITPQKTTFSTIPLSQTSNTAAGIAAKDGIMLMKKLSILLLLTFLIRGPASVRSEEKPPRLTADTAQKTVMGNTFIAPAEWTVTVKGPATILEAPEGDSWIALVDTPAKNAEEALAATWAVYKPDHRWPLKLTTDHPDKDGWSQQRNFDYQTSPNERRDVAAAAHYAGGNWNVIIYDMAQATGEKRAGQVALIFGRFLPKGYSR